ncbi:H-NS histone family protein [Piscinibacter aquaticus]|uniref:H-NS histone family protein n=1 Tax=Piscinibacter aquaticus TaxID=392597 RepID=A0A5C6TN48_9BURK|nr:H-NS histone family protein [Piscinibacter aquaticus]
MKVKPKYRDPQSGHTWTGRGLQPRWIKEALASGGTLERLLIK